MDQVYTWVRRLLIVFNIFFTIVGALVIIVSLALLSPSPGRLYDRGDLRQKHLLTLGTHTTNHIVLYICGSVTMVIAILGVYGAYKEKPVALIVFLVFMVIGCLLTLRAGIPAAVARPELKSLLEEKWRSFLPLDQASDDIKNQADALQTLLHCCGLFSYEDWEQNIPDSCLCNQQEEMEGKCQAVSYRNFLLNLLWQKKLVLRQNCFPLFMDSVTTDADVTLGVVFSLLVLALLGSLLSSVMIYQMFNTSDRPNTPLSVPVMFIDQPPSYQHLYNLPE